MSYEDVTNQRITYRDYLKTAEEED